MKTCSGFLLAIVMAAPGLAQDKKGKAVPADKVDPLSTGETEAGR